MTIAPQDGADRSGRHGTSDPEPIIIAEWPIKRGEIARVSIDFYKGTWLIVRKWFEVAQGEMRPGKGIAMGVKNLPQMAAAVEEALALARQRGLIPADREGGR
jgi:hypothetical protein